MWQTSGWLVTNGLKRRIVIVMVVGLCLLFCLLTGSKQFFATPSATENSIIPPLCPPPALSVRDTLFSIKQLCVLPVITDSLPCKTLQNQRWSAQGLVSHAVSQQHPPGRDRNSLPYLSRLWVNRDELGRAGMGAQHLQRHPALSLRPSTGYRGSYSNLT